MSEPLRWKEPGSGARDELRALLRGAERTAAMTAADQARTAAKLAAATAAGKTAATAGTALFVLKSAAVGAALGAVVLGGVIALGPRPAARERVTQAPAGEPAGRPVIARERETPRGAGAPAAASPATVTTAPQPVLAIQPAPANPPGAPPAARVAIPSRATPRPELVEGRPPAASETPPSGAPGGALAAPAEDPLARETRLMQQASDALDHNPGAALAQVYRIAAEFPAGQLVLEREFIRVRALRALGRTAEARAAAEALLARAPHSTVAPRVRRLLGEMP